MVVIIVSTDDEAMGAHLRNSAQYLAYRLSYRASIRRPLMARSGFVDSGLPFTYALAQTSPQSVPGTTPPSQNSNMETSLVPGLQTSQAGQSRQVASCLQEICQQLPLSCMEVRKERREPTEAGTSAAGSVTGTLCAPSQGSSETGVISMSSLLFN